MPSHAEVSHARFKLTINAYSCVGGLRVRERHVGFAETDLLKSDRGGIHTRSSLSGAGCVTAIRRSHVQERQGKAVHTLRLVSCWDAQMAGSRDR
jgi:hypothetical protein